MKIIRITELAEEAMLDFHPDSAVLLPGRPLFLPDFEAQPVARIYVGVRVNRLGKRVAEKFAERYYDAMAPVMILAYPDMPEKMQGTLTGIDSSVAIGEWTDPERFIALGALAAGGETASLEGLSREAVNRAVSAASRYVTLKMGDVILLPHSILSLPLEQNTHLTVEGPDATLLEVKVL